MRPMFLTSVLLTALVAARSTAADRPQATGYVEFRPIDSLAARVVAVLAPQGGIAEVLGRDQIDEPEKFRAAPGLTGALGRGGHDDDPEKFRVRIDASGELSFNGIRGPVVDPWGEYEIEIRFSAAAGGSMAEITVTDARGRVCWRIGGPLAVRIRSVAAQAAQVHRFEVSSG